MYQSKQVITTLYEKHFHIGVAALLNSLYLSGYSDLFVIGYKKELPPWISQLKYISPNVFQLDTINIEFVEVFSTQHLGYYKPVFLKEILTKYQTIEYGYYFDPDITVKSKWDFFIKWSKNGVCLCLDNCFSYLHHNHPWRAEWLELAAFDKEKANKLDYYVNSGFIGLHRNQIRLLDRWILLTNRYVEQGGNITLFEKEGSRAFKGDQDLLNAAMAISPDICYSVIGKEGMGFSSPAYLMIHAVGDSKPWQKKFIRLLISKGKKVSFGDTFFYKNASFPIKIFSSSTFRLKKLSIKVSKILGRIIG